MSSLIAELRAIADRHGLPVFAVAAAVGVSPVTIRIAFETGKVPPTPRVQRQIAAFVACNRRAKRRGDVRFAEVAS